MSACCAPKGWSKLFGERTARRDAKRYRRKGLDDTAERMVGFLRDRGLAGATVLEVGGGVGAIGIELLRAGAERAVNVELSPDYEDTAAELVREAGLEERVERRLADVVEAEDSLAPADAVVMHRVVCCYPDYDALVGAAAGRAQRFLVMSFPRERRLVALGAAAINLWARLRSWEFRFYVHRRAALLGAAERCGFRVVDEARGPVWGIVALERGHG